MSKRRFTVKYICMAAVLVFCAIAALMLGSAKMPFSDMVSALFGKGDAATCAIMRSVRLPRLVAAILAGGGLSVSGSLLQCVTSNGLASPNIIGVNSGAGFCTILMLAIFPEAIELAAPVAFSGALLATVIIIGISSRIGSSRVSVILGGMALTAILNAGISFISLIDTDVVAVYNYFSIGGLSGIRISRLILPLVFIAVSYIAALIISPKLNALCLGDDVAASLGVRVKLLRAVCLVCASASAAAVVSFAGLLGFVGLIVPHIARYFMGENISRSLIASPLIGASLVLLADMFGRVILSPTEIPVGIVMAAIGAPFFLILLLRGKDRA